MRNINGFFNKKKPIKYIVEINSIIKKRGERCASSLMKNYGKSILDS